MIEFIIEALILLAAGFLVFVHLAAFKWIVKGNNNVKAKQESSREGGQWI